MRSIHPGEVLGDELAVLGVTPIELAREVKVPVNCLLQIVNKKRSVTGDTAPRLSHWFGVDPQFWINLQSQYDLALAMQAAVSGVGDAAHS
ncbi:HigA family addiction module antidote protein [Rhodobacterales bacterium FZCC0069]|nr:HigA family addiction module antidote protein [Rhodobacterales bacterium FZCC0069]